MNVFGDLFGRGWESPAMPPLVREWARMAAIFQKYGHNAAAMSARETASSLVPPVRR